MGQNSEDCADGREKERRVENWVRTVRIVQTEERKREEWRIGSKQ